MSLGIIELLTRVGEDHVRVQNVLEGDVDLTATKRGTKITFYTDAAFVTPGHARDAPMVGLVVWMPRALVEKAQAEHRTP